MLHACYAPYRLSFKEPSGTSRGVLTYKDTYFVRIRDDETSRIGWGECALFRGLGSDDKPGYETVLADACRRMSSCPPEEVLASLEEWTSIRFGFETALLNLQGWTDYPSSFDAGTYPVTINGLVWMGDKDTMLSRMEAKLEAGFRCIKLKIGAIDFEAELDLLRAVRSRFSRSEVELRVDANGAFSSDEALRKIETLASYDLHSIEQPLRAGQWDAMAALCAVSPVPVALDEELIACSVVRPEVVASLLDAIKPQYIVLKPSLTGGFTGSDCWRKAAEERGIGWWITSALESDIGLAAIARYTASLHPVLPQGLGTGALYTNNIVSPLRLVGDQLTYQPDVAWQYPEWLWK